VITQWSILIPPGHASLAHLVIYRGAHPVAPSVEGMDIHGDSMLLQWTDHYEFSSAPYELKLIGWNTDDTYEHTFVVYVIVLEKKYLLAQAVADSISGMLRWIAPGLFRGGTK
jgi:hypothetical protein